MCRVLVWEQPVAGKVGSHVRCCRCACADFANRRRGSPNFEAILGILPPTMCPFAFQPTKCSTVWGHSITSQESKSRKLVFDGIDAASKCRWAHEATRRGGSGGGPLRPFCVQPIRPTHAGHRVAMLRSQVPKDIFRVCAIYSLKPL